MCERWLFIVFNPCDNGAVVAIYADYAMAVEFMLNQHNEHGFQFLLHRQQVIGRPLVQQQQIVKKPVWQARLFNKDR